MASGQIPAVAQAADAEAGFAGDGRADIDLVDTAGFQPFHHALIHQHTGFHDDFTGGFVDHFLGQHPAQHPFTQGSNDVAALDNGGQVQAVGGTAVHFRDDQVLGYIHQATGQVTGVGGLQCRVCQALACSVGGGEVLGNTQPFPEVRGNGRLDDGAVGAGHQATHTRQLTNLGGGTPGTGVGIDIDGIEGFLTDFLAIPVQDHFKGQALHHGLGHDVVGP